MSKPKGKLFALLAIFVAIGLATATGAFTTVQADRTATVNTAGDNAALLALGPYGANGAVQSGASTANTNAYLADQGSGSQIEIDLSGGQGANGLNLDAQTGIEDVFNITNQGSQDVAISITKADNTGDGDTDLSSAVAFAVADSDLDQYQGQFSGPGEVSFANEDVERIDNGQATIVLEPGETVSINIYVDTTGDSFGTAVTSTGDDLLDEVQINADADATGNAQFVVE